jgi:hypothetical protein
MLVRHGSNLTNVQSRHFKNIRSNDIRGMSSLISQVRTEGASGSAGAKAAALKTLRRYASIYQLSPQDEQYIAEQAGIAAPMHLNNLHNIQQGICDTEFNKFIQYHDDVTEITTGNWNIFKMSVLNRYIKRGFIGMSGVKGNKVKIDVTAASFIQSTANPNKTELARLHIIKPVPPTSGTDSLYIYNDVDDFNRTDAATGTTGASLAASPNSLLLKCTPAGAQEGELLDMLKWIDSALEQCLEKYLSENNLQLDEYQPFFDGKRRRKHRKQARKSRRKSRRSRKSKKHDEDDGKRRRKSRSHKRKSKRKRIIFLSQKSRIE